MEMKLDFEKFLLRIVVIILCFSVLAYTYDVGRYNGAAEAMDKQYGAVKTLVLPLEYESFDIFLSDDGEVCYADIEGTARKVSEVFKIEK